MQPMHAPIHPLMLALRFLINVLAAVATLALSAAAAGPQAKAGVERLYILNCGEGVAGDVSRWSPGVNVGKSAEFVDNCYLIRHSQGWLRRAIGVRDAIASCRRDPIQ